VLVLTVLTGFYVDIADELYVALVTSSKANARLVKIDATAALAMRGVVGFLDHTSVPGSNLTGDADSEEIFAASQVPTANLLCVLVYQRLLLLLHASGTVCHPQLPLLQQSAASRNISKHTYFNVPYLFNNSQLTH